MTAFQPGQDMAWLAERHRAFAADLAGTLDLETGLREITIATGHHSVAADLSQTLDLDAGLAAIIPAQQSPATTPIFPPVTPVSPASLVSAVAAATATVRLALRGDALQLAGTMDLFAAVGEARRLAHALAVARGFTDLGDLGRAGRLARSLDAAIARAHQCVAQLRYSPGGAGYVSTGVDCVSGSVDDIARAVGHGPAKIGDVLRTIDLDRALLLAQARVTSLMLALAGGIGIAGTASFAVSPIEASDMSSLRELVNDMVEADLRDADLAGVMLDGVRWSDGTRWPARWVKHIKRHSVELSEGLYEYRAGTTHIGGSLTLVLN